MVSIELLLKHRVGENVVWSLCIMRTSTFVLCSYSPLVTNSLPPSGGYSEMACSQITLTLWDLLGLT